MTGKPIFSACVLTLFPEMFPGPLRHSLAGKALKEGIWALEALNIRDFATDKHATVDDKPYGGGVGMVMKPDIVHSAVEHAKSRVPGPAALVYCTPRGAPFSQSMAEMLVDQHPIILCGRFEGVDQRVIEHHRMLEVSLGDFVLSGGEIAALAMLDACVRLLPGVIGKAEALLQESFSTINQFQIAGALGSQGEPRGACKSAREHGEPQDNEAHGKNETDFAGLLEYPHYTRPPLWNGMAVPEILLSGNHEQIHAWRLQQSKQITTLRRPDLIKQIKKG